MREAPPISLFEKYARNFFDQHPLFKILAGEVGEQSFFVTGGSGLFGQWILAFFEWARERRLANPEITLLVRKKNIAVRAHWRLIFGDLRLVEIPTIKTDYTLHLAAPSASDTFGGMDDLDKLDLLKVGSERILNFARHCTTKRVLMVSSGAIYGGFDADRRTPIDENERSAPAFSSAASGLGLGKRVVELITRNYCDKGYVDASIARCFSFIGPGLPTDLHYAAGNFMERAIAGQDITITGDGKPVRSFMYLGDMVYWLMRILLNGKTGDDYNVGSSEAVSIMRLAEMIRAYVNPEIGIYVSGQPNVTAGNPPNHFYVPDIRKAKNSLNLDELTPLMTSIHEFAKYQQGRVSE